MQDYKSWKLLRFVFKEGKQLKMIREHLRLFKFVFNEAIELQSFAQY